EKAFAKHESKLKQVKDTEFVSFDRANGSWVFKVPHFTTYGLDDDDDEPEEDEMEMRQQRVPASAFGQSVQSTGTFGDSIMSGYTVDNDATPMAGGFGYPDVSFEAESEEDSMVGGGIDDTFDFKKRSMVPGSFGSQPTAFGSSGATFTGQQPQQRSPSYDAEEPESFLGQRSTGSFASEQSADDQVIPDAANSVEDAEAHESVQDKSSDVGEDMAGSFPRPGRTVERDALLGDGEKKSAFGADGSFPVLAPTHGGPAGIPSKPKFSGNWADQLSRTISPRKQNRNALREMQGSVFEDREGEDAMAMPRFSQSMTKSTSSPQKQVTFATSLDLMDSLFGQSVSQSPRASMRASMTSTAAEARNKNFEFPYSKKAKTTAEIEGEMPAQERAFHESFKPRWAGLDTLVCQSAALEGQSASSPVWKEFAVIEGDENNISLHEFNRKHD
ncbi:hypothetical protein KEM55_003819, partial [Ascosphaera atra]